jgi:hypothetical protein
MVIMALGPGVGVTGVMVDGVIMVIVVRDTGVTVEGVIMVLGVRVPGVMGDITDNTFDGQLNNMLTESHHSPPSMTESGGLEISESPFSGG